MGSRSTGKERDQETGLDCFGARYFSGAQGRFLSVDPENAGASSDDPQSWNAYAYGRNNPLKYTDPDGLAYMLCTPQGGCICNYWEKPGKSLEENGEKPGKSLDTRYLGYLESLEKAWTLAIYIFYKFLSLSILNCNQNLPIRISVGKVVGDRWLAIAEANETNE